jgi:hypothetical protein
MMPEVVSDAPGTPLPALDVLLEDSPRRVVLNTRLVASLKIRLEELADRISWNFARRNAWLLAVMCLSGTPVLLFLPGLLGGIWVPRLRARGPAMVWCFLFVALIAWQLVASESLVTRLANLRPDLRALVSDGADEPLRRLMQRELRPGKQLGICLVGALAGAVVTFFTLEDWFPLARHKPSWSHHHPGWTWYVVAFAGGVFAVDGVTRAATPTAASATGTTSPN